MRAGPMRMRLLVGADGELRDMTVERTLRKIKTNMSAARAAFLRRDQRQVNCIRHKVGRKQKSLVLALGGKIIRFAGKAPLEVVFCAEDEIDIFIKIDD